MYYAMDANVDGGDDGDKEKSGQWLHGTSGKRVLTKNAVPLSENTRT